MKSERAVKDCSLSQRLRTSIVKSLFMVCQRHGFLAQPGILGMMCFFIVQALIGQLRDFVAKLIIRAFWDFFGFRLCRIYALLSRIRFCRIYAFFRVCFVQTFTQTLRILLRFCADICPINWPLRPLACAHKILGDKYPLHSHQPACRFHIPVVPAELSINSITGCAHSSLTFASATRSVCHFTDPHRLWRGKGR